MEVKTDHGDVARNISLIEDQKGTRDKQQTSDDNFKSRSQKQSFDLASDSEVFVFQVTVLCYYSRKNPVHVGIAW